MYYLIYHSSFSAGAYSFIKQLVWNIAFQHTGDVYSYSLLFLCIGCHHLRYTAAFYHIQIFTWKLFCAVYASGISWNDLFESVFYNIYQSI